MKYENLSFEIVELKEDVVTSSFGAAETPSPDETDTPILPGIPTT